MRTQNEVYDREFLEISKAIVDYMFQKGVGLGQLKSTIEKIKQRNDIYISIG